MASRGKDSAFQPLSEQIQIFCKTAPLLTDSPSAHSALELHCKRLARLSVALSTAPEPKLDDETSALVSGAVERLRDINAALDQRALLGERAAFGGLDEASAAEHLRSLGSEELRGLCRHVFSGDRKASDFELLTFAAALAPIGLETRAISQPTVILFKLVVILILLLIVLSAPHFLPLAMAIIKALAAIDKAGSGEDEPEADDTGEVPGPESSDPADGRPESPYPVTGTDKRLSRRIPHCHWWHYQVGPDESVSIKHDGDNGEITPVDVWMRTRQGGWMRVATLQFRQEYRVFGPATLRLHARSASRKGVAQVTIERL